MAYRYKISIASLLIACNLFASEDRRDEWETKRPALERSESSRKRLKTSYGFSPNAYQLARVMTDLLIHRHSLGCETPALYAVQAAIDERYWSLVPMQLVSELEIFDLTSSLQKRLMDYIESRLSLFSDDDLFGQVLALESTSYEDYIFDPIDIKGFED